jgi:Zn-dependent protease/predicted transcriptional regulator
MNASFKLGRVFGIEIGLHYSWLIIVLLVALSLSAQFEATNPQWGKATIWVTAIVTALLLFVAIILHELSHAAVAKARGLPVRSITLFALGGVAQMEKDAADAKTEFWMAIVGPIASIIIGLVCLVPAWALGWDPTGASPATPLQAMMVWLGVINISLAVFNMIPGFPLDGGRVLRAVIWWVTGNMHKATRMASTVGQVVALLFIVFGILRFFSGAGFGGLWLAFIGWFLLDAARASYTQMAISESLSDLRVRDVMSHDCPTVNSRHNLQTLVEEHLMRTGNRCFMVEEQGRVTGLITPHEVKAIPRNRWPYTTVDEVMKPLDQLHTVTPEASVLSALELMGSEGVNQVPVVMNGELVGIISRGHIVQLLRTRAELRPEG